MPEGPRDGHRPSGFRRWGSSGTRAWSARGRCPNAAPRRVRASDRSRSQPAARRTTLERRHGCSAPSARTPNAGAAAVLGRAPRPGTSACPPRREDFSRPTPAFRDTRVVAVDVSLELPGADPGRFLQNEPDEALVACVRAGHAAAFEVIYDRYHRNLLAFCRHLLGSREE